MSFRKFCCFITTKYRGKFVALVPNRPSKCKHKFCLCSANLLEKKWKPNTEITTIHTSEMPKIFCDDCCDDFCDVKCEKYPRDLN